ncbi:MAG TPA: PadR family transcriptional regulator [Gemmatimonadaceae bacterium]|nr:PadR family transcriptional regulator [Gemmatimonadaceae bacterium]
MTPNRTEFAILGLLADGPRSGYDIRKEVQETLPHFWNESVGHIYPMLHRLHGRGLVSRMTEPGEGKPARHVYHITEDGLAELREWLAAPVEPTPPRLEILLKLFFGAHTEPPVLIEHIARYRVARERALAALERIAAGPELRGTDARRTYLRLTLSSGIHAARAAIAWCDEALQVLHGLAARNESDDSSAATSRIRGGGTS